MRCPRKRVLLTSPDTGAESAAERFPILAAEIEASPPRRPIPPREMPAALIPKDRWRWVKRRAA